MGLAITQTSTLLDPATTLTNWVGIGDTGTASIAAFPPGGSGSITAKISNEVGGFLWDEQGIGTYASGDHIGMWYSFFFGALSSHAAGGVRFRVTGASTGDFAEVYIGGIDDGKSGWQYVVVSIDRILANPDNVGGSPPTVGNIQHAGILFNITATVGGNNDNVGFGAISHIPSGIAGLRLEGTGTGASGEFAWQDVSDTVIANDYRGMVIQDAQGVFILNVPLVIGDTVVSSVDTNLVDENVVIAWGNQEYVEADFMGFTVESNATDGVEVNAGTKLGSGESAVGVGGWTILTGGPRWFFDAEDATMSALNLYGCAFSGSGPWSINDDAVEIISCVFTNCDTIELLGGAGGPTILTNFFSAAPGPRPQIVFTSGVTPSNGQFDFNTFANMRWFAIEIPSATAAFNLRGVKFSGNGTNRDVLFSHTSGDVQLNVLEAGDSPGVTNGATITITMVDTCDVFMVSAGTWSNALGTETEDQGAEGIPLVTQSTGSLAIEDDTFAIAAAVPGFKPDPGVGDSDITYSGASDEYEDSERNGSFADGGGLIARIGADEITPAAATRTGFPVHTEVETEAVQGIVHIDSAGSTVVNLDADLPSGLPQVRPWQIVEGGSTVTISYGAGNSDALKGSVDANRFIYVAVVALAGTAVNTAVSTIDLNRDGGTSAFSNRSTSFPQQDDNVGTTGRSLELSVYDYDVDVVGQDLDQGTYDVVQSVNATFTNIRTNSEIRICEAGSQVAVDGEENVTGALTVAALVSGGTGYTAADVLSVSGGTSTTTATITVDAVSGGVITEFSITVPGSYSVDPSNVTQNLVTGGTGTLATFALTIRGEFPLSFNGATQGPVDVTVHEVENFVNLKIFALVLPATDADIAVFQIPERNYSNP